MKQQYSLFWFRRDLRIDDNVGLHYACQSGNPVICLFIFDTDILNQLENKSDARITFIHDQLVKINEKLIELGSRLIVKNGSVLECFGEICKEYNVANTYTNRDYEPFAIERDNKIKDFLTDRGVGFQVFKDQVMFEKDEVVKKDGKPYTVYTAYMKKWKKTFQASPIIDYSIELTKEKFAQLNPIKIPGIGQIGFTRSKIQISNYNLSESLLKNYHKGRDFPALNSTSKLGIHLRFGTISIRQAVKKALNGHQQFLNELVWREFFMQILFHFPHVENYCFKSKYESIAWINNEEDFERWCNGTTGYPLVDAGMRELNQTGGMHNRVRMVVASFLCKHLLIDWRWGEAWFANLLLDYDLAANNGNWQWVAGCGCDAAPYFRIFNPTEQQKRFDPDLKYIRKWIPEYGTAPYPKPMIDHKFARTRALEHYQKAVQNQVI